MGMGEWSDMFQRETHGNEGRLPPNGRRLMVINMVDAQSTARSPSRRATLCRGRESRPTMVATKRDPPRCHEERLITIGLRHMRRGAAAGYVYSRSRERRERRGGGGGIVGRSQRDRGLITRATRSPHAQCVARTIEGAPKRAGSPRSCEPCWTDGTRGGGRRWTNWRRGHTICAQARSGTADAR